MLSYTVLSAYEALQLWSNMILDQRLQKGSSTARLRTQCRACVHSALLSSGEEVLRAIMRIQRLADVFEIRRAGARCLLDGLRHLILGLVEVDSLRLAVFRRERLVLHLSAHGSHLLAIAQTTAEFFHFRLLCVFDASRVVRNITEQFKMRLSALRLDV